MKKMIILCLGFMFVLPTLSHAEQGKSAAINEMLAKYTKQGASNFSADGVKELWSKSVKAEDGTDRNCATCHNADLTKPGMHKKTEKVINPMALSANPERYQTTKKIKKWFRRNCKWTWGRECTAQEKGNFLMYLQAE
ncbi:MAG: DUF1924 domain-containing protein [Mariprofundaceae bacterium]